MQSVIFAVIVFCTALVVPSSCQETSELEFRNYLKASNTGSGDQFGSSVGVYGDTIVVGAPLEDSSATGLNGDEESNASVDSGAAYIFVRDGTSWSQQAYLKASNSGTGDNFGYSVAIYGDTVIIGAPWEDGEKDGASNSGAVYVFVRSGTTWTQQALVKSTYIVVDTAFGDSVAIHGDTMVIGCPRESSYSTGVNGDQQYLESSLSGAAYIFTRTGVSWSLQAFLKASNTDSYDSFGQAVSISGDSVVVASRVERSSSTGVNGNQSDNSIPAAGAAYVFVRDGTTWAQQAYLKAIGTTEELDRFGWSVSIYGDAIVVGALGEDSSAVGVNGDYLDNGATDAGAAYMYLRNGTTWFPQAYLKANNTAAGNQFGSTVVMYGDLVLAAAPFQEFTSGAAYAYSKDLAFMSYTKAFNSQSGAFFGWSLALSEQYALICARGESSAAVGVDGDANDNSAGSSGACYVYGVPGFIISPSTTDNGDTSSNDASSMESTLIGSTVGSSEEETDPQNWSPSSGDSIENAESGSSTVLISVTTAIVVLVLLIMGAVVTVVLLRRRRSEAKESNPDIKLKAIQNNVDILKHVTMKEVIGKGAFGEVYLGDCDGTPCACKKMSSPDMDEAIKEANTLFKLSHPNIVRLIGIHTNDAHETYLIMEYVSNGSLTHFLPKQMGKLTVNQLIDICIGIAQGMSYLERKGIVHRDLAARNILVNQSVQPVISDFGLSRNNFYTKSSSSKIPIKWSSPEVIQQGASTSKSDVFSFGITLWETFSFAKMPFAEMSNAEAADIICNKDIKEKLAKPNLCPSQVYSLMIRCWSFEPSDRPSFQDVLQELQSFNATLPLKQNIQHTNSEHNQDIYN